MILRTDITEAGVFNKPHGIKGEISATLDFDIDLSDVKCIVLDVEGIFVPFFIVSVRPKTSETVLITINGIDSEQKARTLTGRPFRSPMTLMAREGFICLTLSALHSLTPLPAPLAKSQTTTMPQPTCCSSSPPPMARRCISRWPTSILTKWTPIPGHSTPLSPRGLLISTPDNHPTHERI